MFMLIAFFAIFWGWIFYAEVLSPMIIEPMAHRQYLNLPIYELALDEQGFPSRNLFPVRLKCIGKNEEFWYITDRVTLEYFFMGIRLYEQVVAKGIAHSMEKDGYIAVDSTVFKALKPYAVMKDAQVDSIYASGGIKGLLQAYIGPIGLGGIPLPKRDYLIYILFKHRIIVYKSFGGYYPKFFCLEKKKEWEAVVNELAASGHYQELGRGSDVSMHNYYERTITTDVFMIFPREKSVNNPNDPSESAEMWVFPLP